LAQLAQLFQIYGSVYVDRLPYVEATILEVLRYKTLAPLAITHCALKDTEVGGFFVPKGTTVRGPCT